MALVIYDHGYRVQTDSNALFPAGNVRPTEQIKPLHRSADLEDQLHADGNKFPLPENLTPEQRKQKQAVRAYANTDEQAPPDNRPPPLLVGQVMSKPAHTISPDSSVIRAWQRMESLEIRHLVVVADDGRPLGVVSDRDLLRHGKDSFDKLSGLYSGQLVAAKRTTELRRVVATFLEQRIYCIPVVDDNDQVIGVVCRSDLLRLLISGVHMEGWA
ncbi:CBS domain-containing protein [Marinobacterium arenosum]|uniref:CBS domain-containing protein n=1 Tax=Marinobacterium arenosum TaxID=2862496 RepID=UPI001C956961|nr:CBS domain-containing protein [Marinobacterium arenosum]MBY4675988.1 CBS domain-containing protein [Marinobacterium arenosum]